MLSVEKMVPVAAPEGKRGDIIDWREMAACAPFRWTPENDPFFPPKGGTFDDARSICAVCPVIADCLQASITAESINGLHGFRAGHTPTERKSLRRRQQRDATKVKAKAKAAAEASKAA